ncbi:FecR family protein [Lunatimonas salinarum]|uniref:FecR family protein n=1 Tax=Lunatimonas salinarum TaxID=1774590 RepID=UPI001AE07B10|nr:FecR family protein [Lunatimonas salinarum]
MKTRENIDSLIVKKLSGKATEEELQTLEDWRQASEINRRYLAQMHKIWEKSMDSEIYRKIDLDKNWKKFQTHSEWGKGKSLSFHTSWWKVAAVIFFTVSGAWMGYKFWIGQLTVTIAAHEQSVSHYLPDGSFVYLQPNSSISYMPESFQHSERKVYLVGKAYFSVHKKENSAHFIINTFNSQTTVLGTSFTLNSDKTANFTRLSLYEGRVLFTSIRGDSVTLLPGERGILTGDKLIEENFQENLKSLNFQNTPVEDVFNALSETYLVDFVLEEAWPSCRISGNLDGSTLEETMRHLEFILGINYRKNAHLVIIDKIECLE